MERRSTPFIWYVMTIHQSVLQDGDSKNNYWGGGYYIHTKDGWIRYPETWSLVLGDLGLWIKGFHLYGGE